MTVKKIIDNFNGKYDFLSNFYDSELVYNGYVFNTAEHAYQSAKIANPDHQILFTDPKRVPTPEVAKKLGRECVLREDWKEVRYDVMLNVVRAKFSQNIDLKEKLLATEDTELNDKNNKILSKILMKVRDELKKQNKNGV